MDPKDLVRIFQWLDEQDAYISCLFWGKFGKGLPRPDGYSDRWYREMQLHDEAKALKEARGDAR